MNGFYKVIVADPPWSFKDQLPGGKRGAAKNYDVMTQADIENYGDEIGSWVHKDALLFLWRVSSQPNECYRTIERWGFEPKSELVWVKTTQKFETVEPGKFPPADATMHFGMGHYTRASHETCVIAAKGKGASLIRDKAIRSVMFAPIGKHSEKPEAFFELVEKLAAGPYLELFARRHRPGWTCRGKELGG